MKAIICDCCGTLVPTLEAYAVTVTPFRVRNETPIAGDVCPECGKRIAQIITRERNDERSNAGAED